MDMRGHLSKPTKRQPTEKALPSNSVRSEARKDGDAVLALVYQAAEAAREIQVRASETAHYAENLAQRAVERLQLAERRIEELEAERRADQAYIGKAHLKIDEAAKALKLERARVEAAEDQLGELERRALAAEAFAEESDMALARIEDAISAQFIGRGLPISSKSTAA